MPQVAHLAGVTSRGASVPRAEKQIRLATITAAAAAVLSLSCPTTAAASGEGVFNSSCAGAFVRSSLDSACSPVLWPLSPGRRLPRGWGAKVFTVYTQGIMSAYDSTLNDQ